MTGLSIKAIGFAVVVIIIGVGIYLWSSHERKVGYENALAAIAAQDARALAAAAQARTAVAQCRAGGGVWNVVDGMCGQPSR